MAKLEVRTEFVNEDKGHRYGDLGWEPVSAPTRGRLFRELRAEYGRCVSKVYVDSATGGPPRAVGWVFERRVPYDDAGRRGVNVNASYLRSTWVTVRETTDEQATESVV